MGHAIEDGPISRSVYKTQLCQMTFKHNRRGLEIKDLGHTFKKWTDLEKLNGRVWG